MWKGKSAIVIATILCGLLFSLVGVDPYICLECLQAGEVFPFS